MVCLVSPLRGLLYSCDGSQRFRAGLRLCRPYGTLETAHRSAAELSPLLYYFLRGLQVQPAPVRLAMKTRRKAKTRARSPMLRRAALRNSGSTITARTRRNAGEARIVAEATLPTRHGRFTIL